MEPAGAGSVGSLSVTGTYAQPGGTLVVDLAGNGINDVLNITGAATLGGTLEVVVDPAYTPMAGHSFLILDAASLSGTFTVVPPTGVSLQANYDAIAGTVTLVVQ